MSIKNIIIVIFYSVLGYFLSEKEAPSVYLTFFSLLVEFVLLLGVYSFFILREKKEKLNNQLGRVLISMIPLIFFHLFISYVVSGFFDEKGVTGAFGLFSPIVNNKISIIILSCSLVTAYIFQFREMLKRDTKLIDAQSSFLNQGLMLWLMSIVGFGLLFFAGNTSKIYILPIIYLSRILLEFWIKKKTHFKENPKKIHRRKTP